MAASDSPQQYCSQTNEILSKHATVFVGLVISGVLDSEILVQKGHALISRWPVLGGVIVSRNSPSVATCGKNFDFKSRTILHSLSEYFPLDFDLTKADSEAPLYRDVNPQLDDIFHFDSLDMSQLPPENIFALRVTILSNATLLGFRLPHSLVDGQSCFDIMKAFSDLILGREIPELIPPPDHEIPMSQVLNSMPDLNIFSSLTYPALEGVKVIDPQEIHEVGSWPATKYVANFAYAAVKDIVFTSNIFLEKYVYLPKNLVEKWQSECQNTLNGTWKDITLSKLDVISAWYLKATMASTPDDDLPVDLMYMFDPRLGIDTDNNRSIFLKNCAYPIVIRWTSLRGLRSSSQAQLALAIRLGVLQNKQPSKVLEYHQFFERHANDAMAYGPVGSRLGFKVIISSWANFQYSKLDFSGALAKPDHETTPGLGKVIFSHPTVIGPLKLEVKPIALSLKDAKGGYWLKASLTSSAWKLLEQL